MIALVATWPDLLVFVTAAALILVGAVGVLLVKNPIHAALSLIVTLLGVALAFLEQSAEFLAAVEIIVYCGAIVVLIVFVLMFLGVDKEKHPTVEPLVGQRFLAVVGAVVLVGGIVALMASSHWVTGASSLSDGAVLSTGQGNVTQLGQSVFTSYLIAFEVTAALLIVAVVGGVLLARRNGESS